MPSVKPLFTFLLILGSLIVAHEFGHFIVAKILGVRVEKFSLGFGWKLLGKRKNDTEYVVSAVPLGGYVKLAGDSLEEYRGNKDEFLAKPPIQRAAIIFFGPLFNYVLGFLFFWLILFIGYPNLTTKVGGLVDGFGAKSAGLQVGDRIMAVDDTKVDYWEDLQQVIQSKTSATRVKLNVLRDGKEYITEVEIREKQLDDQLGQKRRVGILGITPFDEIVSVRHGFFKSFILGIDKTLSLTTMTYKALWRMIIGKLSVRESVTGPLGIYYVTSTAASLGLSAILHLIAVLNVSLAIFNLLPLPLLDGGHIVLLVIEKIRGRYLSIRAERIMVQIGLTIIIFLVIIVTYNDILRFFGDKIADFFK